MISGRRRFLYRPADGGGWKLLSEWDTYGDIGFYPVAVDPVENVAYGYEELDGRDALYKVTLDATLKKTLVYAREDVDVDRLLTLGRRKKVVGLSFATQKRQAVYFDPELGKLAKSLARALPDAGMISFGGMSSDESKVIVGAWSDTNPGQYYLFDKVAGSISPLLAARPELDGYKLAQVKPVTVKAADGTDIPAYLTLPPESSGKGLPAIVMPHGGPSARDEWGFDWLAQFYANRGFAVLQPNYRGSAGYGDGWYQQNGFQSWKVAIGDVNDAGRWLVSEGIADPAQLADRWLVLWRLCRVAISGGRSRSVQGHRRNCSGHRSWQIERGKSWVYQSRASPMISSVAARILPKVRPRAMRTGSRHRLRCSTATST